MNVRGAVAIHVCPVPEGASGHGSGALEGIHALGGDSSSESGEHGVECVYEGGGGRESTDDARLNE
jgi:hypothetical protein